MNALLVTVVVFMCTVGGALGGWVLARTLPAHHLGPDGRDAIKVSIAMVATISALILGLLVASAKSALDQKDAEVRAMASDILRLDRTLALAGPATDAIRADLKATLAGRIAAVWPDSAGAVSAEAIGQGAGIEGIVQDLLAFAPTDDAGKWLQGQALDIASDIMTLRWSVVAQSSSAIEWPFVVVVAFWLVVVFASFGLFAPRNATVAVAFVAAGLSVAGAFYLILDMDQPYSGLIRIANTPLVETYAELGRP